MKTGIWLERNFRGVPGSFFVGVTARRLLLDHHEASDEEAL